MDHYNTGVKDSPSIDHLMQYNLDPGLQLTDQEINDLIAFMKTLTDPNFVQNDAYASPFE